MDRILSGINEQGAGVYVVQLTKFLGKSSHDSVIGVAARRSSRDRPIMFNKCPFCGGDILWVRKTEKGAKS